MDTSAGTSFGDVASYSCDVGYMLIGLKERTCQADGQWNGSVPTCESELLKQDNTVCFYECNHACSMAVLVLRCAFEQHSIYVYPTWHSFPVEASCGLPDIPSNGRVDTSAGTSFGDVATYSCDTGYTQNGPAERTCQADGQWNGSVPTCESES